MYSKPFIKAACGIGPIFRAAKRQQERQNAVKHDLEANKELLRAADYEESNDDDDTVLDILSGIITDFDDQL